MKTEESVTTENPTIYFPTNCNSISVSPSGNVLCASENGFYLFSRSRLTGNYTWEQISAPSPFNPPYNVSILHNNYNNQDTFYCTDNAGTPFFYYSDSKTWHTFYYLPPQPIFTFGICQNLFMGDAGDGIVYSLDLDTNWTQYTIAGVIGKLLQICLFYNKDKSNVLGFAIDQNHIIHFFDRNKGTWSLDFKPPSSPSSVRSISVGNDGLIIAVDALGAYVYTSSNLEPQWYTILTLSNTPDIFVGSTRYTWCLLEGIPIKIAGDYDTASSNDVHTLESTILKNLKWDDKEKSQYDTSKNTHLWLVYKAALLASKATGIYAQYGQKICELIAPDFNIKGPILGNDFHNFICKYLYEADYDSEYSGPSLFGWNSYVSHFYDPDTGTNYIGQTNPTALTQGVTFSDMAVVSFALNNREDAGKWLGLALHYFTDLTQPMHAANYTYFSSAMYFFFIHEFGLHSDFEDYALDVQNDVPESVFSTSILDNATTFDKFFIETAKIFKPKCQPLVDKIRQLWKDGNPQWKVEAKPEIQAILCEAVNVTAQFLIFWYRFVSTSVSPTGLEEE